MRKLLVCSIAWLLIAPAAATSHRTRHTVVVHERKDLRQTYPTEVDAKNRQQKVPERDMKNLRHQPAGGPVNYWYYYYPKPRY
ncbi:MAG TPA: hypothetical protein VGO93_18305 [Candidatus Xenobia bacterium]